MAALRLGKGAVGVVGRVLEPVWTPIIGKLKRGGRGWNERQRESESERAGGRQRERKIIEFSLWRNIPSRA